MAQATETSQTGEMPLLKWVPNTETWPFSLHAETLQELSDECRQEAAHIIAAKLRRVVEGPLSELETWEKYAEKCKYSIIEFADICHDPGYYFPPEDKSEPGCIAINLAVSDEARLLAWVHELAHAEIHQWIPVQLRNAADFYSYCGNIEDAHHDIARRVERLVFGF